MSKFHERLKAMRQEWVLHDQSKDYLAPPLDAGLANLWLYHHGGDREARKIAHAISLQKGWQGMVLSITSQAKKTGTVIKNFPPAPGLISTGG